MTSKFGPPGPYFREPGQKTRDIRLIQNLLSFAVSTQFLFAFLNIMFIFVNHELEHCWGVITEHTCLQHGYLFLSANSSTYSPEIISY